MDFFAKLKNISILNENVSRQGKYLPLDSANVMVFFKHMGTVTTLFQAK